MPNLNFRKIGREFISVYDNSPVRLCTSPSCKICNSEERKKLKSFQGGELEVYLKGYKPPSSFLTGERYYIAHLLNVPRIERGVDEELEIDFSRSNAFLCSTPEGSILIDPGFAGFGEESKSLEKIIKRKKVRAVIISHGHLDHWNQLGLLRENVPVFMSRLTYNIIYHHLLIQREPEIRQVLKRPREVVPGQSVPLNRLFLNLSIETVVLPHSIPETMGMIVEGKKKRFIHLGDFKLAGMDIGEKAKIITNLKEIGEGSIDLLALNVINAHHKGFTPPEALVIDSIANIMARSKRLVIACFSTNLERISQIVKVARVMKKRVGFYGTGMKNAQKLLKLKNENNGEKDVLFVTGCQGEEGSVLWRIAENENPPLELYPDDTLVFSSRCIPGNEEKIRKLIISLRPQVEKLVVNEGEKNELGLENVTEARTHVSGHGNEEDIRLVLEILKPKKVLPWPQTPPQIEAFREIARPLGIEIIEENERIVSIE